MPCNSDYLSQTPQEHATQEAAKNLLYVRTCVGDKIDGVEATIRREVLEKLPQGKHLAGKAVDATQHINAVEGTITFIVNKVHEDKKVLDNCITLV